MSTATAGLGRPDVLKGLRGIRSEISDLRDERAERLRACDSAKAKLKGADLSDSAVLASGEFKAAERAVAALRETDDKLAAKQEGEAQLLSLLGEGNPLETDPAALGGSTPSQLKEPGALLASMLGRRLSQIPSLDTVLRSEALDRLAGPLAEAPEKLGLTNFSTIQETEAIVDLLAPHSVARASGIATLRQDTTKARIPRFTELPTAGWVVEGGSFPKEGPGLEMVDVEPPKVGLVTPLSIELFKDLTPRALAMVQMQIVRAVALAYDKGLLFGEGKEGEPTGIAKTAGIGAISAEEAGELKDLSAFAKAIGMLIAGPATPGALVMNPLDIGKLLEAKEFNTAESNVPLWKTPVDNPMSFRLPYFGVPVWPTKACPQKTALLYDPSYTFAVLREEADISVDPYYKFDEGEIGLRIYLRGDVLVGQPASAVKIEFA